MGQRTRRLAAAMGVLAALGLLPRAAAAAPPAPVKVVLPTEAPSGLEKNDRIPVEFYPPPAAGGAGKGEAAPAVVVLHPLGATDLKLMQRFARHLWRRGMAAAVMQLPYHLDRLPEGERPGGRFIASNIKKETQALGQAAADVSTVASWLRAQPGVDPDRIGVAGVSLGAIVGHLAMGKDERLRAGALFLGGGDLVYLRHHSFLFRFKRQEFTDEERALGRAVDPLTYADRNRPRQVLMIQAARDLVVPPHSGKELWEALGKPSIRWIDTGHNALMLAPRSAMRAAAAYLAAVWRGDPHPARAAPPVRPPTVQAGVLVGLDAIVTPMVKWQAFTFVERPNHLSLLHADLGWSSRGPFAGLALTLTQFLDAGLGYRAGGEAVRPYASLHFTY